MIPFYAYLRVSTTKQAEHGVSLDEQRSAIERYAQVNALDIVEWFEETVTAAKRGRPRFQEMLAALRRRAARGVVIHKIDRGARNLRDWSDLADLVDAGVEVRFANENLDLLSRGGRLAADIQAVVASDYVRNLKEEIFKGQRGRLKQGLWPFAAPLGYLNTGKGKPKAVDSRRGPLIRQAFTLYASGVHTLDSLCRELHRLGLRNRAGRKVYVSNLSAILNNPFYAGLILLKRTGETYKGEHEPLIPMRLFKQVQIRLAKKVRSVGWKHECLFRGLFHCGLCRRLLSPERQKGHIYYRCHTKGCATKTCREEVLEEALVKMWARIPLAPRKSVCLIEAIEAALVQRGEQAEAGKRQVAESIEAVKSRMRRVVDAFLEGHLDEGMYSERKRLLLEEQRSLEDLLGEQPEAARHHADTLIATFELARAAQQSYAIATPDEKREMAETLSSNRTVQGKDVFVEPSFMLAVIEKEGELKHCAHRQNATRTGEAFLRRWEEHCKWAEEHPEPRPVRRSAWS
jgi:DNA invertase Pin-like site-specific DNA recombinase